MVLPDLWWAQQQTIHLLHIYLPNPQLNRNANTVLTKCQHFHTNYTEFNTVSFISRQAREHTYTHAHAHLHSHSHRHMHTHTHTHTDTYTYTYNHTHTHTHTHTKNKLSFCVCVLWETVHVILDNLLFVKFKYQLFICHCNKAKINYQNIIL